MKKIMTLLCVLFSITTSAQTDNALVYKSEIIYSQDLGNNHEVLSWKELLGVKAKLFFNKEKISVTFLTPEGGKTEVKLVILSVEETKLKEKPMFVYSCKNLQAVDVQVAVIIGNPDITIIISNFTTKKQYFLKNITNGFE